MADGSPKVLSIVVPVFRNAGSIPALFERLTDVETKLVEMGLHLELIFVDDGSERRIPGEQLKVKERRPATHTVVKLTAQFRLSTTRLALWICSFRAGRLLRDPGRGPAETLASGRSSSTWRREWKAGSKIVICEQREAATDPPLPKLLSALY
jgi:dolichol-phosphate mannosyltransferase